MKNTKQEASRFLMQATLGADEATIEQVAKQGVSSWLDDQLSGGLPTDDSFEAETTEIWKHFRHKLKRRYGTSAINGEGNNPALPYKFYFHMAWWHKTLTASPEQLLRHRVAQALSEILVISDNSVLELDAEGMANYYDILYRNAFGRYGDILEQVSLHPCMGVYLSHMNNRKADPSRNIHPDENFAREIMQLFSIGLFELNEDGSRKKDAAGRDIPTYDNRDIKELARVFTGIQAHSYEYEWQTSFWPKEYNGAALNFADGVEKTYKTIPFVNMRKPMKIDESYHDRGSKSLLKGHIKLPGRQTGEQEIRTVVERLVSHPSTAPFIARHLINQLVTSNPTPEYIRAVARKFGSQGDMKAAVREILTYPLQHRTSIGQSYEVQSQKLKSPLLRVTQLLRAFGAHNQSGKLWITGDSIEDALEQHPMSAPTVFNFYKPDYVPHGPLRDAGLVAPEFELHTSATSIAYVNMMYYWLFGDYYPLVSTEINSDPAIQNAPELNPDILSRPGKDKIKLNWSEEVAMAKSRSRHEELIDRISLKLTGKTNLPIKRKIKKSFATYDGNPLWVVQTIVFMIAISPEYTVLEA